MFASAPHGVPASNSDAARSTMSAAASVFMWASAMGNWMPWFCPMGRPNTSRPFAYSAACSTKNRASPTHSAAMRTRSAFSPSRM